jgi:hypothetical protein
LTLAEDDYRVVARGLGVDGLHGEFAGAALDQGDLRLGFGGGHEVIGLAATRGARLPRRRDQDVFGGHQTAGDVAAARVLERRRLVVLVFRGDLLQLGGLALLEERDLERLHGHRVSRATYAAEAS